MPTGDTLTVISLALAAMIGALTTSGGRAAFLWVLTAAFVLLAFIYAGAIPRLALSPPSLGWMGHLVNALVAPVAVGVVALMLRELRQPLQASGTLAEAPEAKAVPKFAATPDSRWKPDIPYRDALSHYIDVMGGRSTFGNTLEAMVEAFHSELYQAKITAWGKGHPGDADFFQIKSVFWSEAEATFKTNYVFSRGIGVGAYDVHLSRPQMVVVWPPKASQS